MLVTTLMVALTQLVVWRWNPFVTLLIMGFFFLLEGICASALCYKVRPKKSWKRKRKEKRKRKTGKTFCSTTAPPPPDPLKAITHQ